jgi:hypothetical protein
VRTRDIAIDAAADSGPAFPPNEEVLHTRPIDLQRDVQPAAQPTARPAEPQRVDLAQAAATRALVLRLPDGSELEPSTPVVVGRRPWRTTPEETTTFYVLAPSPRREISGTHLELQVVDGELLARDLDSTNGTLVLTPAQAPRLLHEGRSTALRAGDILDLGEDFRISVSTRNQPA